MTLDVNSPEHDALVDEYRERWEAAIPALCEALEEVEL